MVLQNGTGKPIHLATGRLMGHIITANTVLDAIPSPKLEAKPTPDGEKSPLLTFMQHEALLKEVLEKNGSLGKLDSWSPEMAQKPKCLLMEFHQVFTLEPNEVGCTDAAEMMS